MKNWRSIPKAVLANRTLVDPFPGLSPTRWKIEIKYDLPNGSKRQFSYLGKPTHEIAQRVYYIIGHHIGGRMQIWEFDRAGTIAYADRMLPVFEAPVIAWVMPVCRFYYPWNYESGSVVIPWNSRVMHRLRMRYKGRVLTVYTSSRPADIGTGTLEDHKTWLESAGLQLAKSR
jgi:hypothetical protein